MKIKLQDYSLISNEWIDEHIKDPLQSHLIKQQLIPSEKLAISCVDGGIDILNTNISDGNCKKDIQNFLNSKIEINYENNSKKK